jgi:hypothetical protein
LRVSGGPGECRMMAFIEGISPFLFYQSKVLFVVFFQKGL